MTTTTHHMTELGGSQAMHGVITIDLNYIQSDSQPDTSPSKAFNSFALLSVSIHLNLPVLLSLILILYRTVGNFLRLFSDLNR